MTLFGVLLCLSTAAAMRTFTAIYNIFSLQNLCFICFFLFQLPVGMFLSFFCIRVVEAAESFGICNTFSRWLVRFLQVCFSFMLQKLCFSAVARIHWYLHGFVAFSRVGILAKDALLDFDGISYLLIAFLLRGGGGGGARIITSITTLRIIRFPNIICNPKGHRDLKPQTLSVGNPIFSSQVRQTSTPRILSSVDPPPSNSDYKGLGFRVLGFRV